MAAVAIPVQPEIIGFDKQANVFIAEITVPASPDKPVKDEKKQVPVFILNSTDFIDLQLYLASGLKLPRSQDLFASQFPKNAFDTYLKTDPGLYDVRSRERNLELSEVLIKLCRVSSLNYQSFMSTAATFRAKLLGP